jgi:hypothetical protein
VSITFPVNVAEATMAKQTDLVGSVKMAKSQGSYSKKVKIARHVYEVGHEVRWDGVRILGIESNRRYRN